MATKVVWASIPPLDLSPDELIQELLRKNVEDAKLIAMFGPKSSYSDAEIEEMISALESEQPTVRTLQ